MLIIETTITKVPNSLIRILLGASVVICTDADLNDASVTFLQRLNLDPYVVVNKHKGVVLTFCVFPYRSF